MSPLDLLVGFVEGQVSPKVFEQELSSAKELEALLSQAGYLTPYIKEVGGLYYFLILQDINTVGGYLNAVEALSIYLESKGVEFTKTNKEKVGQSFDLYLKLQPKWLSLSESFYKYLLEKNKDKKGRALEAALKNDIAVSFKYMNKRPKWLQEPAWPIENNIPLLFIEQVDISKISHDQVYLYIFLNKKTRKFKFIEQQL